MKTMYTIDLSEAILPFSLLQILNQFKRMKTGETMEILGVDDDVILDLTSVLPAGKFELIGTEAICTESSNVRLWLKKTNL